MDDRKEFCDASCMVDTAIEIQMEALRRRLIKAVKVEGVVTYKEISEALNQNQTFVQQFVTKRSPKRLYDEQIDTIERILKEKEAEASSDSERSIDAEARLRAALIAFGVDHKLLPRLMAVIRSGFLKSGAVPPEQNLLDDPLEPSNPRHESTPSGRQPQRSTS